MDSTTTLSPEPELDVETSGASVVAIDDDPEVPQALLVLVGDDRRAIPLEHVRAVMRGGRIVRLPGALPWVAGLATARGTLVPVAVLSARASGVAAPAEAPDWLVLAEYAGHDALLGVERVDGVHAIAADDETLPERRAVRLHSHGAGNSSGATLTADVLDVAAVFRELFEED